nr:YeiH family protein [Nocardioides panaciterrulae]
MPGLAVAVAVAVAAWPIGAALPLLGAPVSAIVLGVALSRFVRRWSSLQPGIGFSARTVLQVAVVMLGSQLSLRQVAEVGVSSLPVMLGTLVACLLVAHVLGKRMGIDRDLRTLIGVGTAICGASAIAAVSPVLRARSSTIAYAVSTIFCFNIAAVLLFPPLGHALGLTQDQFGLFAGTAVNDTSSVVAAATTYGPEAGNHAVVVKLTRTLMIIPICLALGVIGADRTTAPAERPHLLRRSVRLVPWFLVGFLLVAAANTAGVLPAATQPVTQKASIFFITIAMAAIGLSTDVAALRKAGARPLILGAVLWVVVTTTSLLLLRVAS